VFRARFSRASKIVAVTLLLAAALVHTARAQQNSRGGRGEGESRRGPVYQRHAYGGSHHDRGRGNGQRNSNYFVQYPSPQVSAGWFQRPYPYHLDYYRMRYGGSYAPYFGNLYGPPQVVTAPPYYGPYYGGYLGANDGYAVGIPPAMTLPPPANEAGE
jgi:hypothetical protein